MQTERERASKDVERVRRDEVSLTGAVASGGISDFLVPDLNLGARMGYKHNVQGPGK